MLLKQMFPKKKQIYLINYRKKTKKTRQTQEASFHYKVRSLRLDFYEKDQFISAAHLLFDIDFISKVCWH